MCYRNQILIPISLHTQVGFPNATLINGTYHLDSATNISVPADYVWINSTSLVPMIPVDILEEAYALNGYFPKLTTQVN